MREVYTDIDSSSGVPGLLSDPNYPNNPASVTVISEFEAPDSPGDFYGQRIRGWIEAPQTGSYTFWIASDDQSELYLSSTERADNRRKIAEVFNYTNPRSYDEEPNQKSAPIILEQGRRYYIEALMVEGSGGDHVSVRWQLPDGTIEEPIPNQRLYVELIPPQIAQQPRNLSVEEGKSATFTVILANRGPVGAQWLRNDVPIPGATNLTYTIPSVILAESGSRYRVSLTNAFATNAVLSSAAFLTVVRDTTPPTLLAVQSSGENGLLTVTFSEPMEPSSATVPGNYTISDGVQVLGATLDPEGRTVILTTTPLTFGAHYFLTVNNVRDRAAAPNPIEADSYAEFNYGYSPLSTDVVYGKSESPGPSTRRTGLTFSEIMYHPAPRGDGRNLKFIEIFNSEPEIVNIGGFKITGSVEYTFPEGTFIPAGGYAVVAAVPLDIQTLFGLTRVYGPYQKDLSASGDLRLLNEHGALLLDMHYASTGDWPSAPDGAGPSLVLARPSYGEADSRAWDASQIVGGSPGRAEVIVPNPYIGLVVNEFLAHTDLPQLDFIEFYNYSGQELDLSGIFISDDISTNKFQVPAGTRIPSLGFVVFDETKLGFALSSGGERIIVRNPQKTRVIESVKFGPQANGVSMGRYPEGSPLFSRLNQPTPGKANAPLQLPGVVISEIMYNPVSGNSDEEYVELYNRTASAVDLSGWRLADGVSYTFSSGTVLAAGSYLAVAKDLALLRTNHPSTLNPANSVGNFSGSLANGGERIVLERPDSSITTNGTQRVTNEFYIVVNEVNYNVGGRWPHWADGGGSSLELIDLNGDNREPSNWADSDETQKSSWTTIERRGILSQGYTNSPVTNPSRNLQVTLREQGEALLDNVQVIRDGGHNTVRNGDFEKGLTDWIAGGTHEDTTLEEGGGKGGGNALHIRAAGRGDTAANRIRGRLSDGLTNGVIATLRADVRWLRGRPEILVRLHGNYLDLPGVMSIPKNLGTPGLANSRAIANSGPVISRVLHNPILPVAGQPVEVSAQVIDPDRVAGAALLYQVDPAASFVRAPMSYRGAGFYSGTIPGQTNLTAVAFYIEAFDARGAVARFPADAPTRTGAIVFGDGKLPGDLGIYRLWLTPTNITRWTKRERSSNKQIDATFVYNNERVVYNMGTLYSGSPYHWNNYDGPTNSSANYLMIFPQDNLFLGQSDFVLNLPSNLGSDSTGVREQVVFWMADQLGQPANYRRYHHLFINGRNRGLTGGRQLVFEDAQQPNHDFVEEWFPDDPDGTLHKIESWFEFDDSFPVNGSGARLDTDAALLAAWTTNLVTGQRELKEERYRWEFQKRAVQGSPYDQTEILRLVRAVNQPDEATFIAQTSTLVDIDEWMSVLALRHAVGDWDSFGYRRGKNMYAYKPENGKWNLMHWDIAFALGLGDGPQTDLFYTKYLYDSSVDDVIIKRMFETPVFRRAYYRALYEIASGPMVPARVNAVIDAKYSALVKNGIAVTSPESIKQWVSDRREYIVAQLANVSAGFAITSNGGASYVTNRNTVLLRGTAPVNVKTIKVNGQEYPIQWTSETAWEIRLALRPQLNAIQLQGYDANGALIPSASTGISITLTSQPEPIAGRVVINEIMYNPAVPNTGYVEIHNVARTTSYDLSGYRLNGSDFTFPSGSVLPPGGFMVIAKDAVAFGERYGYTIPLVGEYSGRLQDSGETLSLIGYDATGTNEVTVSAVRYSDTAPWPGGADGTGASLQLIDPAQDISRVANWTAVAGSSTPGATNLVRTTLAAFPLVWVNEVQPNNVNGRTDAAGDRDPWVELYNSGATPVSLSGLSLTDDFNNLTKWAFPAGASIAAGQRLIVWLDGEPNESTASEWHASFRLPSTAGAIALVGSQRGLPAVFDYLAYGDIAAGHSYGALPEGQAVYREAFYLPSPGAQNTLSTPPVSVFINEWMASNSSTIQDPSDGHYDDWFELYNAGSSPADISGYYLTDNLADPAQFQVPAGTVIPARGFLLVWADSDKAASGVHANFKLSADGESIALIAPDGSIIDSINFGPQTADVSFGRPTDGGAGNVALATPTPGASNAGVDPNALQFTGLSVSQGQVSLQWNGKAGETYRVEYKNNLDDANWTLLRSVTASGSSASTTDAASGSHRFYRIVK